MIVKFTLSMHEELLRDYRAQAERRHIGFSEYIRRALDEYNKNNPTFTLKRGGII